MKNERGVTLIELMIVVAIIAILAAIGSIAYGRYVKSAKIEKVKQIAMEVSSGQERFRARNNVYYNAGTYTGNEDNYKNLLDFSTEVPADMTVESEAWAGDGVDTCNICDGVQFDNTIAGYAVVVTRDLTIDETDDTTIIITHQTPNPVLKFEGL